MTIGWEKKLDILGPLEQAERCLAQWLKEEKKVLPARQHQRVAALMARYFQYEDEVTDELMLSFLRHYSSHNAVDMEDPASVRMEIKAMLDKSQEQGPAGQERRRLATMAAAFTLLLSVLYGWDFIHRPMTRDQQEELKALVHRIDNLEPDKTSAAIWKTVKAPLQVKRYQDMTWWEYRQSRKILEKQLAALQKR
jgi:hypothetical protein